MYITNESIRRYMASTFEKGDLLLNVAIPDDFQDAPISLLISIFIPFEGIILQQLMIVMRTALSRLCYLSTPSNTTYTVDE